MSERLDLADAACPARFQPNFQGGEAKGEDRPEKRWIENKGRAHKGRCCATRRAKRGPSAHTLIGVI